VIVAGVAAVMLLAAVGEWPYVYYQLTRWAVCAATVFVASTAWKFKQAWAVLVFVFVAVLFNPLLPFHIKRESWQVIDLLAAAIFVVAMVLLRERAGRSAENGRNSAGGFWWLFFCGAAAIFLFYHAYDSAVEATTNTQGGYIPIYAGHGEHREVVDERWVDSDSYKRFLQVDVISFGSMGIVLFFFFVRMLYDLALPDRITRE
jgi:hypothetical protein